MYAPSKKKKVYNFIIYIIYIIYIIKILFPQKSSAHEKTVICNL